MGGHRSFFFATMEAIGHSRYLPMVIYPRGAPDRRPMSAARWRTGTTRSRRSGRRPSRPSPTPPPPPPRPRSRISAASPAPGRIGIEPAFLPADAHAVLAAAFGADRLADATHALENLRALKTPAELASLRRASELISEAPWSRPCARPTPASPSTPSPRPCAARRRPRPRIRLLPVTFGTDLNRAPSDATLREGDILSLDSGGNLDGYIGDICRMGILGEPDAELQDLLAAVDAVQQAAFAAIRPGATGAEVMAQGQATLDAGPLAGFTDFVAHGMGLVSHEVPFIARHSMYEATDADRPLEAGMVLSVETTAKHPRRGFIKLEDTVAVTPDGCELFAAADRGWIRAGTG
jgi:Xaa-Pro dipeptidase